MQSKMHELRQIVPENNLYEAINLSDTRLVNVMCTYFSRLISSSVLAADIILLTFLLTLLAISFRSVSL